MRILLLVILLIVGSAIHAENAAYPLSPTLCRASAWDANPRDTALYSRQKQLIEEQLRKCYENLNRSFDCVDHQHVPFSMTINIPELRVVIARKGATTEYTNGSVKREQVVLADVDVSLHQKVHLDALPSPSGFHAPHQVRLTWEQVTMRDDDADKRPWLFIHRVGGSFDFSNGSLQATGLENGLPTYDPNNSTRAICTVH